METNQRNKRDILKEKDRIRKQRQRSLYNDEKKEEMKVKQREYTRKKRLLQSDEEKELKREQARVATQLRHRHRQADAEIEERPYDSHLYGNHVQRHHRGPLHHFVTRLHISPPR